MLGLNSLKGEKVEYLNSELSCLPFPISENFIPTNYFS